MPNKISEYRTPYVQNLHLHGADNPTYLKGGQGDKTMTDSLSLLNGAGRVEATKLVGNGLEVGGILGYTYTCLLYTSPSPRDRSLSRMPSSA